MKYNIGEIFKDRDGDILLIVAKLSNNTYLALYLTFNLLDYPHECITFPSKDRNTFLLEKYIPGDKSFFT